MENTLTLEVLEPEFTVCQVSDFSEVHLNTPYCFTACTEEENSVVCPTDAAPANTVRRDDGWRAFRISGVLDFSLIGILARITSILADHKIGLFAVSTYNTDYVLTKTKNFENALSVLKAAGYAVRNI